MNERLTAIVEHESDDGCIDPDPKLAVASRGTALAEASTQFFKAAPAGMVDGQSRVGTSRLITCRPGLKFK